MVLMALDHVRWFFTDISAYQPETLSSTNLWLFVTRWVTHFCAPGFFLLAGISIRLYGTKVARDRDLRSYLLSRGTLLILLELTVVGYSWVFRPGYSFGGVIWSLGCSFLVMAALVGVGRRTLLAGAALFLLFHNAMLDGLPAPTDPWPAILWRALYQPGAVVIPGTDVNYLFLFPVVPWLAMMVFGYALGDLFRRPVRKRVLIALGTVMIVGFVVLRATAAFGNPEALWVSPETSGCFSVQQDFPSSVISFLNTEKYPPSLQFTLMTLGPVLLWLGSSRSDSTGGSPNPVSRALVIFGREPLFFYICHLYLIHLLALAVTTAAGQPNDWITFGADPASTRPDGYGFELPVIYSAWAAVTLVLYVSCRGYQRYKRTHSYAWLKYL